MVLLMSENPLNSTRSTIRNEYYSGEVSVKGSTNDSTVPIYCTKTIHSNTYITDDVTMT